MKERRTVVLSQNDDVRKIVVIFKDGVDIWRKAYGDDESIDMVRLTKEEFEKLKEIDVL